MKNMKGFLMIFSVYAFVISANAQGPGRGGERPAPPTAEEMVEKATAELGLNDDQVKLWSEIHKNYEEKLKERSTRRATMEEMDAELVATLTDDQVEKFQEMKENQRPPGKKR